MKKRYKWLIGTALFLIAIRIALPFLLENRINTQLDTIEGYHGSVKDVDLQLYRGGFQLNNLKIFEEASENPQVPFVDLRFLDFSIQWKALFNGKLVGEVYLDTLLVNFTKRKSEADTQVDSTDSRINLLKEIQTFNPIQINILEITNSQISYKDPTTSPKIDVILSDLHLRAKNLRNVVEKEDELPADFLLESTMRDSGTIYMKAQLNYLNSPPDFDYDLKMEKIDIPRFNEFLEAYANFDVEAGHFNFYSEGKARNGELEGYAKPLIEGLEVAPADSSDGLFKKAYEGLIEVGTELFENQKEDQIGTKIPISGSLKSQEVDIMQSIWNFLKNAFLKAYKQDIERSIGIGSTGENDSSE